jgi:small subunit ribosomal protein S6
MAGSFPERTKGVQGAERKRGVSLRSYEVIFILDPALGDEGVDAAVTAATGVVTGAGGEVQEVQKWGKKRLAYEVKKRREGHYVYFKLQAPPKAVQELERHFKISESALKCLTVVLEVSHRVFGRPRKSAPRPAEAEPAEQTAEAQEA